MLSAARTLAVALALGLVFCILPAWAVPPPDRDAPADTDAPAAPGQNDAGDPAVAEDTTARAEATPDAISALVRQLNDDKFSVRQAASRQLEAIGAAAIPQLVKAAQGEQLEVTTRAIDLLEKFLVAADLDVKAAAREALETLAASDHEAAASRAAKITAKPAADQADPFGGGFPGGIQIIQGGGIRLGGGGQIKIQVQAQGGGVNVQQFQIQNNNGVKTINVTENGRKVEILDDPKTGIKVTVTTKQNDKEQTKTYQAKNADELQKKHPEAHKLYKKYAGGLGGINFQGLNLGRGIGGNIQIQAQPVLPPKEDAKPATEKADDDGDQPKDDKKAEKTDAKKNADAGKAARHDHLKQTAEQLKALSRQFQLQGNALHAEHFRQVIKQLEEAQQQLEELSRQAADR